MIYQRRNKKQKFCAQLRAIWARKADWLKMRPFSQTAVNR